MNNELDTSPVTKGNNLDIISVTQKIANTNCIVCHKPFQVIRVGKLYCSNRCKQFGYNHKFEINQALGNQSNGISPTPITFYIDDYNSYDRKQKMIKSYQELEKKRLQWESVNQQLSCRQRLGLPADNIF